MSAIFTLDVRCCVVDVRYCVVDVRCCKVLSQVSGHSILTQ
jgi:hypothetical protein